MWSSGASVTGIAAIRTIGNICGARSRSRLRCSFRDPDPQAWAGNTRNGCIFRSNSRNDVGRELVLDEGDTVAQVQFALFEPLNLDDVVSGRVVEGFDRGVEIPVLLQQARQGSPQLVFFLFGHPAAW